MNKVELIGNVARIDFKEISTSKIANLCIAVKNNYKNADGKYDSNFINCVAFGAKADIMQRFVKKGDRLGLIGRIEVKQYEKDGKKAYSTNVLIDEVELLSQRPNEALEANKEGNNPYQEFNQEHKELQKDSSDDLYTMSGADYIDSEGLPF